MPGASPQSHEQVVPTSRNFFNEPIHLQPNGWTTNPPIHAWRIPSSKGEQVRAPRSTNGILTQLLWHTPLIPVPPTLCYLPGPSLQEQLMEEKLQLLSQKAKLHEEWMRAKLAREKSLKEKQLLQERDLMRAAKHKEDERAREMERWQQVCCVVRARPCVGGQTRVWLRRVRRVVGCCWCVDPAI